jgi:excisionase family DNA binding protein
MPTKERVVAHATQSQAQGERETATIDALERKSAAVVARLPRTSKLAVSANEKLLTPVELANSFDVSRQTIWRLCQEGKLPFLQVGNQVRFSLSEVIAALRAQRQTRLVSASPGGATKTPR